VSATPSLSERQVVVRAPGGASFAFSGGGPIAPSPDRPADRTFAANADPAFTQIAAQVGPLTLLAWSGQGGAQPDLGEPRDAFQRLAGPSKVEAARLAFGAVSFSAEGGFAQRLPPFAATPRGGPSYARFGVDYHGRGYAARLAVGDLREPLGPLGSTLTGALAAPARTRFVSFGGEAYLGRATLYGEASAGRTSFNGALLKAPGLLASAWRAGFVSPCRAVWVCADAGLELAQPLRIEGGAALADLAAVPDHYFDALVFTRRRIELAPSGREIDLRLFTDRDLGPFGFLRLEATAAAGSGNLARAPLGVGFVGDWRVRF
jgi:hypothetical protein